MCRIVVEEGLAMLPSKPKSIMTPTNVAHEGIEVDEANVCAVSIIRAGDAMLEAVRHCLPAVTVGGSSRLGGGMGCRGDTQEP